MSKEEFLKEKFSKLAQNNWDKDWNNPVFRQTMTDAFRFCANKYIEKIQSENKRISDRREDTHQIDLECAREGTKKATLEKVKNFIESMIRVLDKLESNLPRSNRILILKIAIVIFGKETILNLFEIHDSWKKELGLKDE